MSILTHPFWDTPTYGHPDVLTCFNQRNGMRVLKCHVFPRGTGHVPNWDPKKIAGSTLRQRWKPRLLIRSPTMDHPGTWWNGVSSESSGPECGPIDTTQNKFLQPRSRKPSILRFWCLLDMITTLQPLGFARGQSRISFDMLKSLRGGLSFLLPKTANPKNPKT